MSAGAGWLMVKFLGKLYEPAELEFLFKEVIFYHYVTHSHSFVIGGKLYEKNEPLFFRGRQGS